jgi:hypothetical protein
MKQHNFIPNVLLRTQDKGTKKLRKYQKSQSLKDLEKLSLEAKVVKCPNTPPHYLVAEKFRDDTANGLTKAIIAHLRLNGHQAERISTTGRPIDNRKTFTDVLGKKRTIGTLKWIPGTGTNGSADISATIAGKSVKLEVKIGSDRQSHSQREYQQSIVLAGGIYFIVTSYDQFLNWYNLNFKP